MKHQTGGRQVSELLVNKVENFALQSQLFLSGILEQIKAERKMNIGLFIRCQDSK